MLGIIIPYAWLLISVIEIFILLEFIKQFNFFGQFVTLTIVLIFGPFMLISFCAEFLLNLCYENFMHEDVDVDCGYVESEDNNKE